MTDKNAKPDDLGALAMAAQQLHDDTQASQSEQGGAGPEQVPPQQTNGAIIAGTLQLCRDTACVLFDLRSPAAVLTDAKIEQLGELWGRVADKRGWNLASALGDYVEEITALMGTIGIARELVQAVVMELDAKAQRDAARTVDAAPPAPQPA
ncbi:hypothetical protein [Acidovorax sp. LjRoot194]|uniref:hypothetical protein n=1 Tax=Acidovorax sp. LjRoot194 TaxID=3342280 RepID=UPI003ECD278C